MSYKRSHLGLAWRIIINSAPLSRAHRSASSAAQRHAVPRGAVPCRALRVMPCGAVLLCGAVPCCAVLRAFFCTSPTCQVSVEVSYHRHYCCTCQVSYVESQRNALTAQLSPAIAQQRSAMRCRTVPCLALRCCAVLHCAFFRTYSSTGIMRYPVPAGMYVPRTCVLVFFSLSSFDLFSVGPPFFPRKLHPYWRSERDIANKHTQHSTG